MATTTTHDRLPHQVQVHTVQHGRYDPTGEKALLVPYPPAPSKGKILAVVALLPVGAGLLGLAGITLVGTLIGMAVATPLFILFSPIIVPAILTIGMAVVGFLTSGTFGLTGLSSLSFLVNFVRQLTGTVPDSIDSARRRMQDLVEYTGQKTKEVGQSIKEVGHEMGPEGQVHGGAGGQISVGGQVHVGGGAGAGAGAGAKEGRGGRT
ncbi:oleosin-like [Cynara cardunculus var. scolymus]|uniref:Oleosin n=1 Tax=Cynara cardunculus var. scolymus TaxID=59895 RepID=A0A103YHH8_CYNCS|nr:oleosin-like [Cynara cardunculus var. scolymus]KVI09191.1 Oleosin [Cynara cardunculus var. scolymus]